MRIIGGKLGKRVIKTSGNLKLRPTTDQAKEALFNILTHRYNFEQFDILDLFAGTGSISYEFISRGARKVYSIENNLIHFRFINMVKAQFDMKELHPLKTDVFKFLENNQTPFDIIFADPPFDMSGIEELPFLALTDQNIKNNGLFIVEHSRDFDFSAYDCFIEERKYGKIRFSFFEKGRPRLSQS
jgi:16S rRNA (guanine966-N2)-methyltransferase